MTNRVFSADTHWRNSMKPARFGPLDARAAVPFVCALLHLRLWTLGAAAFTTFIFWFLEQRGMSFDAALRALRVWFVTRKRPGVNQAERRRLVDYGLEPLPEADPVKPDRDSGARKPTAAARVQGKPAKPNATPTSPVPKTIRPSTVAPAARTAPRGQKPKSS